MGMVLLKEMLREGVAVHYYSGGVEQQILTELSEYPNFRLIGIQSEWEWNRWYSSTHLTAFLSGTLYRVAIYNRLIKLLLVNHRTEQYDCIFQLSQMELFRMGEHINDLPPIVVYPCSHAAGELKWHRKEAVFARQAEGWLRHYLVRGVLIYRALKQKAEVRRPHTIVGASQRFNTLMRLDYGLSAARQVVLRHPIASFESPVPPRRQRAVNEKLVFLYIARMSVRKGLDLIIDLSWRMRDCEAEVEIQVVGGPSLWSNYTPHLRKLNPQVARYLGSVAHEKMPQLYLGADALLLPSYYEPGALVVGEALSFGLPVVVSDEVGPSECLDHDCCRTFPVGNADAFESAVRLLAADLRKGQPELARSARTQAEEKFSTAKIGHELSAILRAAALNRRRSDAS